MLLLLDNFDSFTYNLQDYLLQLGKECRVYRNDVPLSEIIKEEYEGVVLSPGPETPSKAGNLMEVLDYYIDKLPIFGVCLGFQAIGEYFGGRLGRGERPMHGKVVSISHDGKGIFEGISEGTQVVRYNSLVIDIEGVDCLEASSYDMKTNELMSLRHKSLLIRGVQFHPEAILTKEGLKMLENWVKKDFS